ncbi:MAG: saccharopine dehydrogenase NADP-binding domain-containing protein [Gammaproteobacteria bacterium]|nr:saccharopine dehydrogenase NADP-binding domain-containing protein [Gammaproteobacteria bacterium]
MKHKILIYGAGGYMGKLFTQYASQKQLPIVLGSRDFFNSKEELRLFSLENTSNIIQYLHDVKLVVNLAGPFVFTQLALIEACLETGTHYIDISGEVPEFESAFRFHEQAKQANIMILPGAGFGVVPTDIAAKLAHQKLPDATHLKLAYVTVGGATRGTLKTVLKDIHKGGIEIVNGKAVKAMPAKSDFNFEADGKNYRVVSNPWRGDLFTAQYSTQIANIQTYANFPGFVESMMKGKLLWLRDFILNRLINLLPVGPSEKALKKGKTYIFAEVKNEKGKTARINIKGPEAYVFTAQTLTNISLKIINGDIITGFNTPSIYGPEIILSNFNNVIID